MSCTPEQERLLAEGWTTEQMAQMRAKRAAMQAERYEPGPAAFTPAPRPDFNGNRHERRRQLALWRQARRKA